ncbi:uncharacterized protein LOC120322784 isoform X2 [Pipra filicauda]|uniref:Uncharacterized protein LOC120322784 isoform X2 n=1 Tax=Pipra filicauda TaxID=649802 RepID=A0A7R5KF07_9PASS|nr:uncharacterized protein LOC120322784 isoform X2 [Pipra filicauda]
MSYISYLKKRNNKEAAVGTERPGVGGIQLDMHGSLANLPPASLPRGIYSTSRPISLLLPSCSLPGGPSPVPLHHPLVPLHLWPWYIRFPIAVWQRMTDVAGRDLPPTMPATGTSWQHGWKRQLGLQLFMVSGNSSVSLSLQMAAPAAAVAAPAVIPAPSVVAVRGRSCGVVPGGSGGGGGSGSLDPSCLVFFFFSWISAPFIFFELSFMLVC